MVSVCVCGKCNVSKEGLSCCVDNVEVKLWFQYVFDSSLVSQVDQNDVDTSDRKRERVSSQCGKECVERESTIEKANGGKIETCL